ncbi:MAG: CCA tRNA nucleotidyltransferase [Hyphomicrobiales bacterium]|nr:CCA tRNA nucleotidyltransferase [Hyphomicrobiales bacterium]
MTLPARIDAVWLRRPATQAVFEAIERAGFEARAVGGAVRNALIGKPVSDVDIATTALPDDVIRAAVAAGLAAHPTGIAHGTVTVVSSGIPHEVTTLRRDRETFGRHATVDFTNNWIEDAQRRDFTINALYCDRSGAVHDPLGGFGDLEARRVRFIGNAVQRIREDYLRILRFFRFTAEYAPGEPDEAGLRACGAERAGLEQLSAERIRMELLKILCAPRAIEIVVVMHQHGFLAPLLGFAPAPAVLARTAALDSELARAPDAIARLGALCARIPEDARRLAQRLRLSGHERERLVAMVTLPIDDRNDDPTLRVALYRQGAQAVKDRAIQAWALSGDPKHPGLRNALDTAASWVRPELPVGGADVIAAGIPPGPRVGTILGQLEQIWIDSDFTMARRALLDELAAILARP